MADALGSGAVGAAYDRIATQAVSIDECKKSLDAHAAGSCVDIVERYAPTADVTIAPRSAMLLHDGKEIPVVQIFGAIVSWNISPGDIVSVTVIKFVDAKLDWCGRGMPVRAPFILDRKWMDGARKYDNRLFLRLDLWDGDGLLNGLTFDDSIRQQFSVFGSVAEKLVKAKRRCQFDSCVNGIYTEDDLKEHYNRMHFICHACGKVFATQLGLNRHNKKCTSSGAPLQGAAPMRAIGGTTTMAEAAIGPPVQANASGCAPSLPGGSLAALDICTAPHGVGASSSVPKTKVTLASTSDRLLNEAKHLLSADFRHAPRAGPKRVHGFDSVKLYSDLSRAIFREQPPTKLKLPQNSIMARLNENTPGHGYADLFTGVLDKFRSNYPPSSNRRSLVPWAVDSYQVNEMAKLFTMLFAYIRKDDTGLVNHSHKMRYFLGGAITMERTAREMGGEFITLQGDLRMMNDKYNIMKRAVEAIEADTGEPETKRRCQLAIDGQDALDPPIIIDD